MVLLKVRGSVIGTGRSLFVSVAVTETEVPSRKYGLGCGLVWPMGTTTAGVAVVVKVTVGCGGGVDESLVRKTPNPPAATKMGLAALVVYRRSLIYCGVPEPPGSSGAYSRQSRPSNDFQR